MQRLLARTGRDAAALLLGLILAAGSGELLLRWFWPQRSDVTIGMFRDDPDAGYRLQSNYRNYVRVPEYRVEIRTDSDGYRVPVDSAPEDARASKMLVVGDSFTFGVGVNAADAFPHALETRLEGWEVRNGGVGGYGPLRTERLLRARQAAWDPDVLVHAIYVGNDLWDARPTSFLEEPRIEAGRMVAAREARHVRARLYLRTHSHLYAFLRERLYGLYRRTSFAERSQARDPMGLAAWPVPIREVSWPAATHSIEEIAAWSRRRGTRYFVMVIPTRYQVEDESWVRYRREWDLEAEAFDRDHAQREVTDVLRRLGVPFLDVLEPMRQATADGARLYYESDQHWTVAGHALAARLLHEELDRRGWVDGTAPPELARADRP